MTTKLTTSVAVLAITALAGTLAPAPDTSWLGTAALAQESGGQGNQGGQGQGSKGSQGGQANQGGQGTGQGGPGEDSDSKGPQAGGPASSGSGGGKPAWAQEGIPEVELGRLSVARAPAQVLDRSYTEALATIAATPDMVAFYSDKDLATVYELLRTSFDTVSFIDSPLQNLALLKEALTGTSALYNEGVSGTSLDVLEAIFLGAASDKTVPITYETVQALSVIFNVDMTESEISKLAIDAEIIRTAILEGHG